MKYIIGIDEVGRGPVAGPVSVGIVVLPTLYDISYNFRETGLTDSKKMSPTARERVHELASEIQTKGDIRFGVYSVTAAQIDQRGIEQALRTAIEVGLTKLAVDFREAEVLLDGRLKAPREFEQKTIIRGDFLVPAISLASVVAKVERDAYMSGAAHAKYPEYGFNTHKGYGTEAHYAALKAHGLTPIHRRSFLRRVVLA